MDADPNMIKLGLFLIGLSIGLTLGIVFGIWIYIKDTDNET